MASGDYDTKITLGMEADLSGGVQTEKQLEKVRAQTKKLEQDSKSGGASIEQAFGKATRAVGFFRKALGLFGAVAAINAVIAAIGKVKESFGDAKKEAEKFADAREMAGLKTGIEDLAKSYEALGRAIVDASEKLKRANELQDIATKNARALEDAQMDLAEQKELSAIDANDPAAAEKRAAISARYAARRGVLASSRSREDIDAERNRLSREAGSNRAAAGKINSSLEEDDRLIKKIEQMIDEEGDKATKLNAYDIPEDDKIRLGWSNVKKWSTFDWGHTGERATQEGEEFRKRAAERRDSLREQLKTLKENRESKKEKAEKLLSEAKFLDEKAGAIYQAQETVDVKETTARVTGQRGMDDAETSLEKKNKEIAKKEAKEEADRATIAQGPGRIAAIEKKIDAAEAQQLAAQQADAKEQQDAILAQQALDSFNAAGHRRNGTGVQAARGKLEAAVERETREAAQSRSDLNALLATLSVELKGLRSEMARAKREIEAATKRQAAVNDEAPGG
ncbi:MAG: hypothetical protein IJI36_07915 [Kiritimatiellae bacterium]|nr:hypothetical protein [Kiritimatiellia bacterium]